MKQELSSRIGHIPLAPIMGLLALLMLLPLPAGLTFLSFSALGLTEPVAEAQHGSSSIRFAIVGDFGSEGQPAADVGRLIAGWKPDFVITTGDNNYPDGATSTIDRNIGQYYHSFISPYKGTYGAGATTNRFFPTLGNHDWDTQGAQPYLDYFALPGNERYYDFVRGPVHYFVLDSDPRESDGTTATSVQGKWLKAQLASATEPWKLVYFHHPPFSSGDHGSNVNMQWPYQEWGASAVLAGHDHDYERIVINSFPYFVNGLGGRSTYDFHDPVPGSVKRFTGEYGAMLADADGYAITYRFITRYGETIDTYTACRPWNYHPGEIACITAGSGGRRR